MNPLAELDKLSQQLDRLRSAHAKAVSIGLVFRKFVVEADTAFFSSSSEEFPDYWCSLSIGLTGDGGVQLDVVDEEEFVLFGVEHPNYDDMAEAKMILDSLGE